MPFKGSFTFVPPPTHNNVQSVFPAITTGDGLNANFVLFWAATLEDGRFCFSAPGSVVAGVMSVDLTAVTDLFELPDVNWDVKLIERSDSGCWILEPVEVGGGA